MEDFTMSEREIVLERLREKGNSERAKRLILQLLLFSSLGVFATLLVIQYRHSSPSVMLPPVFGWNVLILVGSSLLLWKAMAFIKRDELVKAFRWTGIALIFGIFFVVSQLFGSQSLMEQHLAHYTIFFPVSLIYLGHVVVALAFLGSVFVRLSQCMVHSKSIRYARHVFLFWHFLVAFWVLTLYGVS